MTHRIELETHLASLLESGRWADYGPNGLQVEGRAEVQRLICGVTASLAMIEAAIDQKADALLVHHGLFWRGQEGRVTGWMKKRLAGLLRHDINLYAYHLPLDAHPSLGNNAQLGLKLGLKSEGRFGDKDLGWLGQPEKPLSLDALQARITLALGRPPRVIAGDERPIRRVGWCTGGAQGHFEAAINAGADAYITGEMSEPQPHLARETGVAFLACGHHATERYGVQALGQHLATTLGLDVQFIDIDNPA
ncbi:Nif3-like dinuclear metal center hexameric protein [Leptothrix ochracea]|uniref:Nif3-like dinuclear metal center hexameric protein n=1 Tax=Leptothrix ochracea TaxID=735331 RepID=UPI0034E2BF95